MAQEDRVIVVGAGPVGAVMTLALVRKGIPVTLLEQLPDAAEDQRAATIHPPTVEMLVELGLEQEAFSAEPSGGMSAPLFQFRDRTTGELYAEFDINLLKGEVPLSVRAAVGAVQAGACGAAAHQGERHRRGAFLSPGDRVRAACRPR